MFSVNGIAVRLFKDDDFGEKGWAYRAFRKATGEHVESGHTYDHDRDGSVEYVRSLMSGRK